MGSIFPLEIERADGTKETRWRAQLSIGTRKSRRYVTRTETSRNAAVKALSDLRDEHAGGKSLTTLSLGDYLRRWLDESAKPTVSANTYRGYNDVLIHHLAPIADIPIRRLSAEDIEWALGQMVTHRRGSKAVRTAAPKTIRNAQLLLRRALGQAEQRGHVAHNVARQVTLRRVPRQQRDVLTPELAHKVLAAIAGDPYEAAFALGMVGLRASEILGLARSDLKLGAPASVTIRRQLVGSGRRAHLVPGAKTEGSASPVPLPPFVVSRLAAHLDAQPRGLEDSLVFVNREGYAVNASWLTKRFARIVTDAGLPRMTLHSLRHGAATLLVGAGAHPRIAQELLRHATSKTTLEIYSHVSAGQQREAVELLEKAVAG